MLTCLVPVLFTFYIQCMLKLKKNNSGAKGLIHNIRRECEINRRIFRHKWENTVEIGLRKRYTVIPTPRNRNMFPLKEGSVYYRYLKSVFLRIQIIVAVRFPLKTVFPFAQVPFHTGFTVLCGSLDAFYSTQGPVRALISVRQQSLR